MSDTELAEFGFLSRLAYQAPNQYDKLDAYPGTRRYQSEILKKGKWVGGFSNIVLTSKWLTALQLIETAAQWKAMWVDNFGWHNKGKNEVEYVVFINDTVWVERIDGHKAYLRSLCVKDAPPTSWDPFTLVLFTVITRAGDIIGVNSGWVKTLVIRRQKSERIWIDVKYLTSVS